MSSLPPKPSRLSRRKAASLACPEFVEEPALSSPKEALGWNPGFSGRNSAGAKSAKQKGS
jgi:hypothetical protein